MISFGVKYWVVLLPAFVIAAVVAAGLLYFRNDESRELGKMKSWFLGITRFLAVFLTAFLMLSPLLKHIQKIVQNPAILVAWDNSKSISSLADSTLSITRVNQMKDEISKGLGADFRVVNYTFGEKSLLEGLLTLNEKKSDYGEMIESMTNNHFNENIGALIVAGDGISNHGKNPVNLVHSMNFPVYTLGLGDTATIADARIENTRFNRTSFTGNKFPVEVDIHVEQLAGKPLKLTLSEGNTEKSSTMIIPAGNDYFTTYQFMVESGKPGLIHYNISLQKADNERNIKNNLSSFVVHILDSRQKILILSEGPHPDAGAIKNTLELQLSYDVKLVTGDPYPVDLTGINLLILNQFPTISNTLAATMANAEKGRIPVLYLTGDKTFFQQFNLINKYVKVNQLANAREEIQPVLNQNFVLFNISDELKNFIGKFPPLQSVLADYTLDPELNTLFYQRIKNIETSKPLIALGMVNGRKTGYIFGEGLWRWRLFNYYSNQSHASFNELINQIVQYLALKPNEDNFIINHKPVFNENESVVFGAELYNDNYERVANADINFVLTNDHKEELKFSFDATGNSYQLNTGNLPVGDYTFEASVKNGDKTSSKKGSFTVVALNLEDINLRANHNLLYQMSANTGGKFYNETDIKSLINEIKSSQNIKPVNYFQELINQVLNMKWIFFVILLLFSVEWFLRKYWGLY